jgi:hypothetical protein
MQEYWEAYMKPVEGHPSMVSFNAGVSDSVPDDEYMYVGFVKVRLKSPSAQGLISSEEEDEIGSIEDRLEMESLRYRVGKYIGRIVTQGSVNFIYCLKLDFEWGDVANAAMKHFEAYTYESGSRADREWEVYQKLLFPTSKEWQIIHNHHACDQLRVAGDNLRLKRAIEHRIYFENPDNRSAFARHIETEGFSVQKEIEPTEEAPLYGLKFYRIDTPYYYDIDALTLAIIDQGERFGGQYDGWETSLVKM